jgi:hypothetical protein
VCGLAVKCREGAAREHTGLDRRPPERTTTDTAVSETRRPADALRARSHPCACSRSRWSLASQQAARGRRTGPVCGLAVKCREGAAREHTGLDRRPPERTTTDTAVSETRRAADSYRALASVRVISLPLVARVRTSCAWPAAGARVRTGREVPRRRGQGAHGSRPSATSTCDDRHCRIRTASAPQTPTARSHPRACSRSRWSLAQRVTGRRDTCAPNHSGNYGV